MGSLIFLTRGKRCSDPSNQRAIIQSILDNGALLPKDFRTLKFFYGKKYI
jgi:hypothetical protein